MNHLRDYLRLTGGILVCVLAAAFASCQQYINYPAPVLQSITPTSTTAGTPNFILTVVGQGFTPATLIYWNSVALPSIYNPNNGDLSAQVPSSLLQTPGQAGISVQTPPPGGGISVTLIFQINPSPSQVPQITALAPLSVTAGSATVPLNVIGRNFVPQSTVMVNGNARTTSYSSATLLQVSLTADDVASAGTVQISVFNPPPDGGSSNSFTLPVTNPSPVLSSLTPTGALAGSAGVSLALTGSGYVSASQILINGAPRATILSSATRISASLTGGDLVNAGVLQVQVVNPAPGGGSSQILTFAINPTDQFGLPVMVDLGYNGAQANNGICGTVSACAGGIPTLTTAGPAVSTTGEFAAFASNSTNFLATPANTSSAIFVRDTCLDTTTVSGGATSCLPITTLVSLGVGGALPNAPSDEPSLDSAASHVAYTSTATNLVNYAVVPGNVRQVYWQPTCISTTSTTGCSSTGITPTTDTAALVSVAPDGVTPGNGDSYSPVISADGQYVAFVSLATNLVSGVAVDGVTPQVYIRNTCNFVPPGSSVGGCTPATYLVSTPDGSTPGNEASAGPAIANSGLFVSFTSAATNLAATSPNPSGIPQVYERSTCITTISSVGTTCVPSTTLISSPDGITPADGPSVESALSQDGRFVAFASSAANLISGDGPVQQVYLVDTCTGAAFTSALCTRSIHLISTGDGATPANALAENPSISQCVSSVSTALLCDTGQFIAFATKASNLGPGTAPGVENIFARNTCLGLPASITGITCVPYTFLASQPSGVLPSPANGDSMLPAISGDGRNVTFLSSASNLVGNDSNNFPDIFLAGATPSINLAVALQGSGSGTVTDSQSRLSCTLTLGVETGTCSVNYLYGTSVTLTATPAAKFQFLGWGGSVTSTQCPATSQICSVTLTSSESITAKFQ